MLKSSRAFKFLGFGWDYGGAVSDWGGGRLDGLEITLAYRHEPAEYKKYFGDGVTVSSDDGGLAALGVEVAEMVFRI